MMKMQSVLLLESRDFNAAIAHPRLLQQGVFEDMNIFCVLC